MTAVWKQRSLRRFVLMLAIAGGTLASLGGRVGAGQVRTDDDIDPARKAIALRVLNGAFDTHAHTDIGPVETVDIAKLKLARKHGMRGMILKSHFESTVGLAAMVRKEIPDLEVYGGVVLNRWMGGINVPFVKYMAELVGPWGREGWGRVIWFPTNYSWAPFPPEYRVPIQRNGELLPEVKEVISLIAKHNMVLFTGHATAEECLMLLREGRKQGAKHMAVTHLGGMNISQMQEAVKLGAFVEFEYRAILLGGHEGPEEESRRHNLEMIRKLGPEHSILIGFWTRRGPSRGIVGGDEYAGLEGMADFVDTMHAEGFTDRDLDLMMKHNPSRLVNTELGPPLGSKGTR